MKQDVFKENTDTTTLLLMMKTIIKITHPLTRHHLKKTVTMTSIGNTMVRFIILKKNGEKLKEKQAKKIQQTIMNRLLIISSIMQKALLNL